MKYSIRNFSLADSNMVNRIAISAFKQYKDHYSDWLIFSKKIENLALLAKDAELIVATIEKKIVGAVGYVPPGKYKKLFPSEWPVVRMLVVDPDYRGFGIGKSLMNECIQRAVRDNSPCIGLHTSPIMEVALSMYLRMGFVFMEETSPIHGVPYSIYLKTFG